MAFARAARTVLRTAHILAFGALYGGAVYAVPSERLDLALIATLVSGFGLMAFEMFRTPEFALQARGLATLLKIGLLAGAALSEPLRLLLLTAAAVIGAVSSHMPGRYRYYSIFHGRVLGSEEKG